MNTTIRQLLRLHRGMASSASAHYPAATPERASEIAASLQEVRERVTRAAAGRPPQASQPKLIAVSKYKPMEDIMACYAQGQRDFGENYAAELAEKAAVLPQDIRWHFIGGLQGNKCKPLAAIPNIHAVQTVDSNKKAAALNRSLPATRASPLYVYIQINTSGEDAKSGILPLSPTNPSGEAIDLARFIINDCPRLRLAGLMTIGSFEASTAEDEENPDFTRLLQTRDALESSLKDNLTGEWGVDGSLELSMGMSSDFEPAIKAGSGIVRVGTSIFGSRA